MGSPKLDREQSQDEPRVEGAEVAVDTCDEIDEPQECGTGEKADISNGIVSELDKSTALQGMSANQNANDNDDNLSQGSYHLEDSEEPGMSKLKDKENDEANLKKQCLGATSLVVDDQASVLPIDNSITSKSDNSNTSKLDNSSISKSDSGQLSIRLETAPGNLECFDTCKILSVNTLETSVPDSVDSTPKICKMSPIDTQESNSSVGNPPATLPSEDFTNNRPNDNDCQKLSTPVTFSDPLTLTKSMVSDDVSSLPDTPPALSANNKKMLNNNVPPSMCVMASAGVDISQVKLVNGSMTTDVVPHGILKKNKTVKEEPVTDLIDDIPYYLHRRHIQLEPEPLESTELCSSLVNSLNRNNESKRRSRSPGRRRPGNVKVEHLRFSDPLPLSTNTNQDLPSFTEIRNDRSTSGKRTPTRKSPIRSPNDRSPSSHRLVNFHNLPAKDSYSCVDHTTTQSEEKDIANQVHGQSKDKTVTAPTKTKEEYSISEVDSQSEEIRDIPKEKPKEVPKKITDMKKDNVEISKDITKNVCGSTTISNSSVPKNKKDFNQFVPEATSVQKDKNTTVSKATKNDCKGQMKPTVKTVPKRNTSEAKNKDDSRRKSDSFTPVCKSESRKFLRKVSAGNVDKAICSLKTPMLNNMSSRKDIHGKQGLSEKSEQKTKKLVVKTENESKKIMEKSKPSKLVGKSGIHPEKRVKDKDMSKQKPKMDSSRVETAVTFELGLSSIGDNSVIDLPSPAAALILPDIESYPMQQDRSNVTFSTFKPPEPQFISGGHVSRSEVNIGVSVTLSSVDETRAEGMEPPPPLEHRMPICDIVNVNQTQPKRVSFHDGEFSSNMSSPVISNHIDSMHYSQVRMRSAEHDPLDTLESLPENMEPEGSETSSSSSSSSSSSDSSSNEDIHRATEFYHFAKSLADSGKELTADSGMGTDLGETVLINRDVSLDPLEKLEQLCDDEIIQSPDIHIYSSFSNGSSSSDSSDDNTVINEKRPSADPLEGLEQLHIAEVAHSSEDSDQEQTTPATPPKQIPEVSISSSPDVSFS